jgi:hypothetical protein
MHIEVTDAGGIALGDPDDFKAFSVRVLGAGSPAALEDLGRLADDDHVYVDPAVLLRLAGERAEEAGWRESLDEMIAFAADHGWVDEHGFIRAHVDRHP